MEFDLSGRYWTEALVVTRDLEDRRVNVFQDHWSGFSVAAASPIDCRLMAPELGRAEILVRRLLWLGVFGLLHGAVLWYGDILLHYAYCGLLMMVFRSWTARRLLWVGGGLTLLWGVVATLGYWGMANMPPEIAAQMAAGRPQADPANDPESAIRNLKPSEAP